MQSRKEAIKEFKDRKPLRGAFAVRCTVNGHVWVGTSPNMNATINRFRFALRLGGHPENSLQLEWNLQGEAAFQFEILETLEDDLHPLAVKDLLKAKGIHWTAQLGARPA